MWWCIDIEAVRISKQMITSLQAYYILNLNQSQFIPPSSAHGAVTPIRTLLSMKQCKIDPGNCFHIAHTIIKQTQKAIKVAWGLRRDESRLVTLMWSEIQSRTRIDKPPESAERNHKVCPSMEKRFKTFSTSHIQHLFSLGVCFLAPSFRPPHISAALSFGSVEQLTATKICSFGSQGDRLAHRILNWII